MIKEKALGCFLGLAVGDALGSTIEFSNRDSRPLVTEMIGKGPFNLLPGQWTDDTSMALCLAQSLIHYNGLNKRDLMFRFSDWWRKGENSSTGRCFDIGGTTKRALINFERDRRMANEGVVDDSQAGNGSLMRLAPVPIFYHNNIDEAIRIAEQQSLTTHATKIASDACKYYCELIVRALNGESRDEILTPKEYDFHSEIKNIAAGSWHSKTRERISSSGYVADTLEAAIWCIAQTANFENAIILAVNLGDDSDTVGAVTGQLAGALYGIESIPERWLEKIYWRKQLEETVEQLL